MEIGTQLKAARQARGLSVSDLSQRTRVSGPIIEAIERNDFSRCGGDVFARGHVRAMAIALGMDPQPLIEEMGASLTPTALPASEPDTLSIWDMKARSSASSERRIGAALSVVAVLAVVGLLWYIGRDKPTSELRADQLPSVTSAAEATVTPEPTPVTPTTEPMTTEQPTTEPSPIEQPSEMPSGAASSEAPPIMVQGGIELRVDCTESSFVRVENSKGILFSGSMSAGDWRRFRSDTDVTVTVSNAAGVDLTVNGERYMASGAPGQSTSRLIQIG